MTIYKQELLLAKVDRDFKNLKALVTNSDFGKKSKNFEKAMDL